jgi:predicted PurR-regulated permease PerM
VSATDIVLIITTIVSLAAIAALAVTVSQLRLVVRSLRKELQSFRETVQPAAERLDASAKGASRQVDRLDNLIGAAGSLTETVDGATASAVRALSNPVIKTAAVARGTKKAARRLTKSDSNGEDR